MILTVLSDGIILFSEPIQPLQEIFLRPAVLLLPPALVIVHGAAVSCFVHVVGEISYLHLGGRGVGTDPPDVRIVVFRIVVGEEFKWHYDGIGDAFPPEVVEGEVGILYDIVE